jgi:hypothetical protein
MAQIVSTLSGATLAALSASAPGPTLAADLAAIRQTIIATDAAVVQDLTDAGRNGTGTVAVVSPTEAILTTAYASYTFEAPNLVATVAAGLANHAIDVNLDQVIIAFHATGDVLSLTGNIGVKEGATGGITVSGDVTTATMNLTYAPTAAFGTQATIALTGDFSISHSAFAGATIHTASVTTNGLLASAQAEGSITVAPTTLALGGTITEASASFTNGESVQLTGTTTLAHANHLHALA